MKKAHTPISQIVPQSPAWMPALSALIEVKLLMKSQLERARAVQRHVDEQHHEQADRQGEAGEQRQVEGQVLGALRGRRLADRVLMRAHSYTCLYLRTNRIEIRFMTSVITNSVMPTAKIVL